MGDLSMVDSPQESTVTIGFL